MSVNSVTCVFEPISSHQTHLKFVNWHVTDTEGLSVRSLVTDRHRSVAAFIRDDLKVNNPRCADLEHYNDVWHTAKGKLIKFHSADI